MFFCRYPPVFRARNVPIDPPTASNPFEQKTGRDRGSKKRKIDEKKKDKRENNENMMEEFKIKEGESWEKVFCRGNARKRISWSGDDKIKI